MYVCMYVCICVYVIMYVCTHAHIRTRAKTVLPSAGGMAIPLVVFLSFMFHCYEIQSRRDFF